MSNEKQVQSGSERDEQSEQPRGACTQLDWKSGGTELSYEARADWLTLRKNERPVAEMFYVSYCAKGVVPPESRPLTFVFNGGPGASSAYLHMGALGPTRVRFGRNGEVPPPPAELIENPESWLLFTDLVFIDPIGTGFSRGISSETKKEKASPDSGTSEDGGSENEFWQVNRDLESIGEFIQKFLSRNHRWESPIFIAGESYGGFRVAKLARKLQESFGVGLNGAIIISPAMEFISLDPSDYDILSWMDVFPSMAAASFYHGYSTKFSRDTNLSVVLGEAEKFATTDLMKLLANGDRLAKEEQDRIYKEISAFTGLSIEFVQRKAGRLTHVDYVRNLMRDQGRLLGLYDASVTGIDPFPARDQHSGPDPTLQGIGRVFTAGINTQIRKRIGVDSERDYQLLNLEVNKKWKDDEKQHFFRVQVGASDDLRFAMCLNPDMKVYLCHGYYDLVTPYFSSGRLIGNLRLDPELQKNLQVEHFPGGHMFYIWDESRQRFTESIRKFVSSSSADK